jgi:hypothetical protein
VRKLSSSREAAKDYSPQRKLWVKAKKDQKLRRAKRILMQADYLQALFDSDTTYLQVMSKVIELR